MYRIYNYVKEAVAGTTAETISCVVGSGTISHLLFGKVTAPMGDTDTIGVILRDKNGSRQLVPNLTVAYLKAMSDSRNGNPSAGYAISIDIGLITLKDGAELSIVYNHAAASSSGTVYISGVYTGVGANHIKQYVQVTEQSINHSFNELFVANCGSYPAVNVEIGFKNQRSSAAFLGDLLAASQVFANNADTQTGVAMAYRSEGFLSEVEYVRYTGTDAASVVSIYVVYLIDRANISAAYEETSRFRQSIVELNNTEETGKQIAAEIIKNRPTPIAMPYKRFVNPTNTN